MRERQKRPGAFGKLRIPDRRGERALFGRLSQRFAKPDWLAEAKHPLEDVREEAEAAISSSCVCSWPIHCLPPLFPTYPPPPTARYKYRMPVPDFAIINSPDDLQRSTFRDISPTELDQVLPPPNNYVYPLPELPQAPPPPLQLAYIPPLSVLFFPMPPSMPEPPVLHKVWILDCKSCGKFLTNRGMKVRIYMKIIKFVSLTIIINLQSFRLSFSYAPMYPCTLPTLCQ